MGGNTLFLLAFSYEMAFAVLALVLAILLHLDPFGSGFALTPEAVAIGLAWALPQALLVNVLSDILPQQRETEEITKNFVKTIFKSRNELQLVAFAMSAGIGEELLFRGVIQQKAETLIGLIPGITATALLFGACHNLTPTYFLLSSLGSCIFSFVFTTSGYNLLEPILAHAFYDYVAIKMTIKELEESGEM
mmetsp:Transcript_15275/g.23790  ORF Transcript_15275/g.23790 Transcript_15275/m.23790 type:complete len:192 (-) Transcript_15275:579-1154(-)